MARKEKKQRLITLCGCDQCGKTHIAKALAQYYEIPYYKVSTEKKNFAAQKRHRFLKELRYAEPRQYDMISQLGLSIVFDRGLPCEYAYSKVFSRTTDPYILKRADLAYSLLGMRIVVCFRSNYYDCFDADRPDILSPKNLEAVESAYREWCYKHTCCQYYFLNVDDENLDREIKEIVTWMDKLDYDWEKDGAYKEKVKFNDTVEEEVDEHDIPDEPLPAFTEYDDEDDEDDEDEHDVPEVEEPVRPPRRHIMSDVPKDLEDISEEDLYKMLEEQKDG